MAKAYVVRLTVAAKGELELAVAEGSGCVVEDDVRTQTQGFTITGGTGIYQGASGSGAVHRSLGLPTGSGGRAGRETWTGTVVVPALRVQRDAADGEWRRVQDHPRRAGDERRVRARYAVTARDDADGAVPVSCSPRSGSRLSVGRTLVTCSATDTSGNTKTVRFTVTVKQRP